MNRTLFASVLAASLTVSWNAAQANSRLDEGRSLYEEYNCAQCHGADARSGPDAKAPRLAGMNPDDVYIKTKRFIESARHDEVTKGCGETPNHVQIKRISDYVASLPR